MAIPEPSDGRPATAGRKVIAEVEEIVEVGELDPEKIVTPHLYVDLVVLAKERL